MSILELDGLRKEVPAVLRLGPQQHSLPMDYSHQELKEIIHAVNHYLLHNVGIGSNQYHEYTEILEKLSRQLTGESESP